MIEITSRLSILGIAFAQDAQVSSPLLRSRAKLVIFPASRQVPMLLPLLHDEQISYQPLGSGSNTLLTGTDASPLQTVIISMKGLREQRVDRREAQVTADAGVRISSVSGLSAKVGLTGLEFARDIPGTTAGAVATDAWHPIHNYAKLFDQEGIDFTGMPKNIRDVLTGVELVGSNGESVVMNSEELGMQDRSSLLTQPDNALFLLSAQFQLQPGDQELIDRTRSVVCLGRKKMRANNRENNPYSVGKTLGYSFVLNHPTYQGMSAMQLIATADLADEIQYNGMYHSKQTPNIICSTGSGTADGYLRVADRIREGVSKTHGIEMPLEVRVIN